MPDRIIRDEIWSSDRFLDLPTDAARLAFFKFLSLADDFGNFEGGSRRLFRALSACTQIKSEEACASTVESLLSADLIRGYHHEGRELFHIPRFRSHRQYLSRLLPMSPWCDKNAVLGKEKRIIIKGIAKDVVTTSLPRSVDVAEGVGVIARKTTRPRKPRIATKPPAPLCEYSKSTEIRNDVKKVEEQFGK